KTVTQNPLYKEVQNPEYVFRSTSLEINSPAKRRSILHVFFELGMPGKYSIEVQRLLPRQLGPDIVKSNAIMLTIIPRTIVGDKSPLHSKPRREVNERCRLLRQSGLKRLNLL